MKWHLPYLETIPGFRLLILRTMGKGGFEIPFPHCHGSFIFFTVLIMVIISLAGPKVNAKAFILDTSMFKLKPQTSRTDCGDPAALVALYVKFW